MEGNEHQNSVTWITWGCAGLVVSMVTPGLAAPWEPDIGTGLPGTTNKAKIPVLGGERDEMSTAVGWALGG